MPEITSTATTDTAKVGPAQDNVRYVTERPKGNVYRIEPQPPARREDWRGR